MIVYVDGDGCPRGCKDLLFRAAQKRGLVVTLVANRPVVVPRHVNIKTVVVSKGLDVADDWLVANAPPGALVVTSDVPLAAELVAKGVDVLSPRGEPFTASNVGEKLSMRDFFTEARASGLVEGGGPPPYDEKAARGFANALDRWVQAAMKRKPAG